MSRRPLDLEVSRARRDRDKKAADLIAAEAKLAALLRAQAELIADLAEDLLPVHGSSVNTDVNSMQLENRIAISKGRSATSDDPFFDVIRSAKPKGFTLRSLAKRIGTQPSLLSAQRKGDRPIPRARAEEIAKLTGWPADFKHWPGGLA